jgi:hypothetical protein
MNLSPDSQTKPKYPINAPWLALGIGVGTALGVVFHNIAVGVSLGTVFGILGATLIPGKKANGN